MEAQKEIMSEIMQTDDKEKDLMEVQKHLA